MTLTSVIKISTGTINYVAPITSRKGNVLFLPHGYRVNLVSKKMYYRNNAGMFAAATVKI